MCMYLFLKTCNMAVKRIRRSPAKVRAQKATKKKRTKKQRMYARNKQTKIISDLISKMDTEYRSRKLSTFNAVKAIMYMNETATSYDNMTDWLHKISPGLSPSTLHKRFRAWVRAGIPERVWKQVTTTYINQKNAINRKSLSNLFIDSTMIKNDLGVDCTGPNPTDRGRNGSKISVITTADRVVIGYSFAGATKH